LGSHFRLSIVKLIVNSDPGIEEVLSKGMIVQYKMSETVYCFSHDQIKEVSYSLLPKDSTKILLYMGLKLWKLLTSEELEENIYTVAKLLCHGIDLVDDQGKRFKMAELFMQAGNKGTWNNSFNLQYFLHHLLLIFQLI